MVIRDEDLGPLQLFEQVRRKEIALLVVALRIIWKQHTKPVTNRDARTNNQERVTETRILSIGEFV